MTSPTKQNSPQILILNKTEDGVNFQENIIIFGSVIDGIKTLVGFRNMKNIFKHEFTPRGINN
jgi:hypothetical protein